jgi:hypothetical protein
MEAEARISADPFAVHVREDRDLNIDVVMHDHSSLARGRAQDPTDVLDDAAFELDGKGEEHRVECRAVETFTKEARCSNQNGTGLSRLRQSINDGSPRLLTHAPLKHKWREPALRELRDERVEVFGPPGENQTVALFSRRRCDVVADRLGPVDVDYKAVEDLLDVLAR